MLDEKRVPLLDNVEYKQGKRLGEGSHGEVYEVFPKSKNKTTANNVLEQLKAKTTVREKVQTVRQYQTSLPAVKKIIPTYIYKHNIDESKITGGWFHTSSPQKHGENSFFITERLNGRPLVDWLDSAEFLQLTHRRRALLIFQLVDQVCSRHQNKFSTGPANYHGDISKRNVMLEINQGKTQAYLFDCGFSSFLSKQQIEDPNVLATFKVRGNPVYYPPESVPVYRSDKPLFGPQSDNFMLAAPILNLLGEPSCYRAKVGYKGHDKTKILLKDQNVIEFPDIGLSENLRDIVLRFIKRMQNERPQDRPHDDEMWLFFLNLYKLTIMCEESMLNQQSINVIPQNIDRYKTSQYRYKAFAVSCCILLSFAGGAILVGDLLDHKKTMDALSQSLDKLGGIPLYAIAVFAAVTIAILAASACFKGRTLSQQIASQEQDLTQAEAKAKTFKTDPNALLLGEEIIAMADGKWVKPTNEATLLENKPEEGDRVEPESDEYKVKSTCQSPTTY
ncbi:MAG: serine/threonine-protein kinase [Gammaproteobacteria bacterium]